MDVEWGREASHATRATVAMPNPTPLEENDTIRSSGVDPNSVVGQVLEEFDGYLLPQFFYRQSRITEEYGRNPTLVLLAAHNILRPERPERIRRGSVQEPPLQELFLPTADFQGCSVSTDNSFSLS